MRNILFKIGKYLKPMFPNLPTDNLYKFGFVGCLFLLGLGVFYIANYRNQLIQSYDSYSVESVSLDLEYNKLTLEFEKAKRLIRENKTSKDSSIQLIEDYEKRFLDFKDSESLLNSRIKSVDDKMDVFNSYMWLYGLCILVLMSGSAFFCYKWYHNLQKFQDMLLQLQLRVEQGKLKSISNRNES